MALRLNCGLLVSGIGRARSKEVLGGFVGGSVAFLLRCDFEVPVKERDERSRDALCGVIGVIGGRVAVLLKCGFELCVGGGHTGSGEKHVDGESRGGGMLGVGGPVKDFDERSPDDGNSDANLALVPPVRLLGSVALLPSIGFETCNGGTHSGICVLCVNDDVRDGPSLGTDVAAVDGRDEATLTIDDRLDATVEMSDG